MAPTGAIYFISRKGSGFYPGADRLGRVGVQRPTRAWAEIQAVLKAQAEAFDPGPGDHGAVVGAERGGGRREGEAVIFGKIGQPRADRLIGGDAPGNDQGAGLPGGVGSQRATADTGAGGENGIAKI